MTGDAAFPPGGAFRAAHCNGRAQATAPSSSRSAESTLRVLVHPKGSALCSEVKAI